MTRDRLLESSLQLLYIDKSITRCRCDHLTNFAVLMDINGVLRNKEKVMLGQGSPINMNYWLIINSYSDGNGSELHLRYRRKHFNRLSNLGAHNLLLAAELAAGLPFPHPSQPLFQPADRRDTFNDIYASRLQNLL